MFDFKQVSVFKQDVVGPFKIAANLICISVSPIIDRNRQYFFVVANVILTNG